MCMSRLHQVLRLTGVGVAEVEDVDGARHVVSLLALDGPTPAPGEWLTVHSGYALDRWTRSRHRRAQRTAGPEP